MNVRWSPPADEVRDLDAAPWDGPLAFVMRPLPYVVLVRTAAAAVVMYGLAGVVTFLQLGTFEATPLRLATVLTVGTLATIMSCAVAVVIVVLPPRFFRRYAPFLAVVALSGAGVLITLNLLALGPGHGVVAALYIEAPIFAYYMLRWRYAALIVVLIAIGYAVVVGLQYDAHGATARWAVLMTTVVATGIVVGGIAARAQQLSASEQAARTELAGLNTTLEQRVAEQVDELDRLGRMRRFVSPQIADVLMNSGTEESLQPHRRRIAAVFCDLRGFTAFTNSAEPEEVVDVLAEYYRTAGEVLRAHHATIGGYAGDGIMSYFGDPVPSVDPALDAVRMARDLVPAMNDLVASWAERGHRLHYGVGIAHGYATLGVVGFDGRYDYTPLGAVVNLAARLCSCAAPGQVLLDQAAHVATAASVKSREVGEMHLKGFDAETRVYALEPITLRAVPPSESAAG